MSKTFQDKEKDGRTSPETNAQQQMANQRASGGNIDAPPEVFVGIFKHNLISKFFNHLFSFIWSLCGSPI